MKSDHIKSAIMLAGIGGLLFLGYKAYKGAAIVGEVVRTDLNPAHNNNVVYRNTPQIVKTGMFNFYATLDKIGILPR